jgi:hypothetical protein
MKQIVKILFVEGYILPFVLACLLLYSFAKQFKHRPANIGVIIGLLILLLWITIFTLYVWSWR